MQKVAESNIKMVKAGAEIQSAINGLRDEGLNTDKISLALIQLSKACKENLTVAMKQGEKK